MTYSPRPAFASTSGVVSGQLCKMLILGEAWGESEDQLKRPFVGESGKLLWDMLGEAMPEEFPDLHARASALHKFGLAWVREREAWLQTCGIAMTNVLALRPPANKMEELCCDKKDLPEGYSLPALSKGKYLREEFLPELDRLADEISFLRPNIILALGNTACWATLRATNIGSIRGAVAGGHGEGPASGIKVLPTYHPAGVLRNWSWRPIVVTDLMKAWRQAQFPEVRRPERAILVSPTLLELETFLLELQNSPPPLLSVDIETGYGQIKCIGFATSRDKAVVIPFWDPARPGWHYWPQPQEELRAWEITKAILELPIPKLGQNFLYDLQYILKTGIRPQACLQDTMLLHHSHFPEMQKGLGFLGSVYTDENSWKLMNRHKPDTEKRDE